MKTIPVPPTKNLFRYKGYFLALAFFAFSFLVKYPVNAHHPFEGKPTESFNLLQGLLSGLGHPILGFDHLIFLFTIGLISHFSAKHLVFPLLISGLLGTSLSLIFPNYLPGKEIFIGLTLLFSAFVSIRSIDPKYLLPLIGLHGYVLGQSIIGAEPTPILGYIIGLLISETLVIILGILFFRKFSKYRKICLAFLVMAGLTYSCIPILGIT